MKKSLLFFLFASLLLAFSADLSAQNYGSGKKKKKPAPREEPVRESRPTDDYFDDKGNLKAKLWYGAGGTLQFNQFGGNSIFAIGVRPMVGYKITPAFSVGPTVGISYVSQRSQGVGFNSVRYGAGAFGRYRIIPAIFAHAEYYIDRVPFPNERKPDNPNRFSATYQTFDDFLIGLGYQSGNGLWGQSIEVLYNVTNPPVDTAFPFDLRISLNYNF